ncbi:MAG: sulfate transporter CysZ [Thermodesulfobacteriota bacterium]
MPDEVQLQASPRSGRPGLAGGFMAPLRGARFLLRHPRLISLAVLPILINTVLLAAIFYLSLGSFLRWLAEMLPKSQAWYWVILSYVLPVLMVLFLLAVIVLVFTPLANIIASPFNDALSARTEVIVTGRPEAPFSFLAVLKEAGRTAVEELKKIVFYLAALAVILVLNFIPVVGQVLYTVLGFLLTVMWLGLNYLDYPLARHGYRFGGKLGFLKKNSRAAFGYGLGVLLGFLVPIFNLAFISLAVVGGTLLYLELTPERTAA